MEKTKNLGLNKQEPDEIYDVQIINDNMDIIDEKVQECFQSVSDGKALMASGITDKGVPTDADATFQEMYDNVMAIQTNPTLQSKNASLSTSEQVITADTGYDGLSKVIVPAVTGNASDGDVVAGKEFSSASGINQVGTLVDKTGVTEYTATASLDSTNSELEMKIPATGKYNTSNKLKATFSTIASLIGLTAAKLVKGNTILGITGNSNNMDTSGADATAGDVLSGKKVGVKGSLITGSMTNRKGTTVDATAVSSDDNYTYFTTPAGCYSAASKVRTPNSNLVDERIKNNLNRELTMYVYRNNNFINHIHCGCYKKMKIKETSNTRNLICNDPIGNQLAKVKNGWSTEFDVSKFDYVTLTVDSGSGDCESYMFIE